MDTLNVLTNHSAQLVYVYLAVWALAALAHTMPAPVNSSSNAYRWTYNLAQFLLANLAKLKAGEPKAEERGRS